MLPFRRSCAHSPDCSPGIDLLESVTKREFCRRSRCRRRPLLRLKRLSDGADRPVAPGFSCLSRVSGLTVYRASRSGFRRRSAARFILWKNNFSGWQASAEHRQRRILTMRLFRGHTSRTRPCRPSSNGNAAGAPGATLRSVPMQRTSTSGSRRSAAGPIRSGTSKPSAPSATGIACAGSVSSSQTLPTIGISSTRGYTL